jgi:hypothetical protein
MTGKVSGLMWQRLVVICALLAGVAILAPGTRAATVSLVSFSIDEAAAPTYAVFSDRAMTGTNEYKDYRLSGGGESDLNFCVEADATRSLFIRFNRKLDGESGVERCDTPDDQYGTGRQRQYLLEIRNASACAELGANGYLPNAEAWTAPCTITGGVNPRIRMGSLFGKNARFPVDFLTTNPTQDKSIAISYEIQSLANATIVAGPGDLSNVRTVSYSGMAKLAKFGGGTPSTAESFPLPFKMTFVRHTR